MWLLNSFCQTFQKSFWDHLISDGEPPSWNRKCSYLSRGKTKFHLHYCRGPLHFFKIPFSSLLVTHILFLLWKCTQFFWIPGECNQFSWWEQRKRTFTEHLTFLSLCKALFSSLTFKTNLWGKLCCLHSKDKLLRLIEVNQFAQAMQLVTGRPVSQGVVLGTLPPDQRAS